jgi:SAM-dependent methyltransferase
MRTTLTAAVAVVDAANDGTTQDWCPHVTAAPRKPWVAGLAFVRKVVPRAPIDDAWDWLRFKIDSPVSLTYQPLAWVDTRRASGERSAGTLSRWEAMLPIVREQKVMSAVDVGCNLGWFTINFGKLGIPVVGIEQHPPYYRTVLYGVRKSRLSNVGVLVMRLDPENAPLVPRADCLMLLSIWHHLVREQGKPAADEVLRQLWDRTGKVLFFDTGENEMPATYGLPAMVPDARTWLTGYLTEICEGGEVRHLGMHQSGEFRRNLFAVIRAT